MLTQDAVPRGGLGARRPQHPFTQRHDETRGLRDRNEPRRRHVLVIRAAHAHQRLGTGNGHGTCSDDGEGLEGKANPVTRLPQGTLEDLRDQLTTARLLGQLSRVEGVGHAFLACLRQRELGAGEHFARRRGTIHAADDSGSYRRLDFVLLFLHEIAAAALENQALGYRGTIGGFGTAIECDREASAAEVGDEPPVTCRIPHSAPGLADDDISRLMPVGAVHVVKPHDLGEDQGHALVRSPCRQIVKEGAAIGHARHRVVVR